MGAGWEGQLRGPEGGGMEKEKIERSVPGMWKLQRWEGLGSGWLSLGASWEGLRASGEGLRASWEGLRASRKGLGSR